jgi:Ca-activated chloride channel family protein
MSLLFRLPLLAAFLIAALLGSCSKGPEFTIVAGSENQILEPMVMAFCKSQSATCHMQYLGSLDIAFGLKPGGQLNADAVWPASSIWIDAFDTGRRVKSIRSIARMPVILGVRLSKARDLGWIGKPVSSQDIVAAVDAGKLKFLMTSATQSNSGATAYLAMLAAALGKTDPLTAADLENPQAREVVRHMLGGVARSSGSSGWLADLYLQGEQAGMHYDGMWNYEAVIAQTNRQLRDNRQEPLYAIYPADGVGMADSPLGFVDRGRGPDVEEFFNKLQAYLLSDDARAAIAATGRRVAATAKAQPVVNAETNIDTARQVTVIRPPEPTVIETALALYQTALRRPSLTALCLDVSGSMEGDGIRQVKDAMRFLLTPERTRAALVQWLPADRIVVLPFNGSVLWWFGAAGTEQGQAALLQRTEQLNASDGTDFYACAAAALRIMKPIMDQEGHLPAIVIMTDGKSQGAMSTFETPWTADGRRVPVFGVTFGSDADKTQLDALARLTGGRVFDGTNSLTEAFRTVRGYN